MFIGKSSSAHVHTPEFKPSLRYVVCMYVCMYVCVQEFTLVLISLPPSLPPSLPLVPGMVQDLTVGRSEDNKTVVAQWKVPEITPPQGDVSRYEVEYRDTEKVDSVSTVFRSHRTTFLVVRNVVNANSYQV